MSLTTLIQISTLEINPWDRIWRNRLEAGTQKFSDCPEKYKDDVIALLKEDVVNGKITAERYAEIVGESYEA